MRWSACEGPRSKHQLEVKAYHVSHELMRYDESDFRFNAHFGLLEPPQGLS